ncbi:MAG: SpoIID/LytB domain-containing protein [Abditibacteriota bacterium]|nr:SpoIID/LytB domain-containing protein [Abditibacteriota bacterium]
MAAPKTDRGAGKAIEQKAPVYTVPVRLTRLSGKGFSLTTRSLSKSLLCDTPGELLPGTQMEVSASGDTVVAKVTGETFRQKKAVISGVLSCGGKNSVFYEGSLEITAKDGKLSWVCVTDLEKYTAGVLACEASMSAPSEALKAQALAIRTYGFSRASKAELCDASHCQTFRGVTSDRRALDAAAATKGQLLLYGGAPISAMYCADSGGISESGNADYLKTKRDPVKGLKHVSWNYVLPKARLAETLGLSDITGITAEECSASGRMKKLLITDSGANRSVRISGEALRAKLGYANLKSTLFSAAVIEHDIVFSGKGYGHGVGLCQTGCCELARIGWRYDSILAWYYDGAVISDIASFKKSLKQGGQNR